MSRTILRHHRRVLAAFSVTACLLLTTSALAEHPPIPPRLAVPSPQVLLLLIRTALIALNQAAQTGNFTVLHDLGAPAFQAADSPARLGVIFADLINRRIDLSPVAVVTPELKQPPLITQDSVLHLAGHFPTQALRIEFEMAFQPVNGNWRLLALGVQAVPAVEPLASAGAVTGSLPAGAPVGNSSERAKKR